MTPLSLEDTQHLAEEIRHLVRAGMPLEESLAEAGKGRGRRFKAMAQAVSEGLNRGESLQKLVEDQAVGAPRMLASAIGAGVRSGDLGLAVELMGDFAADVLSLRNKLFQSAMYPLTIPAVASLLIVIVIQHALELFLDTIVSWNIEIHPWLRWLLEFNRDVPWWTLIFPAAGFLLITLWMVSGRAASMNFRGPERLLLLLPGVRPLVRDLQTYTAVRMMSLLIERGLPLQEALILAGGASGSGQLDRACRESAARVENGQSAGGTAGTAVSVRNQLPPLLRVSLNQVEQNEERLVHRLRSVAEFYRNRMERNATWIRLTMPVLMFVMVGGGTVLAYGMMVFWPMSEIYRNLGN